jgi:ubiquinone/menaquinone biosynthesis C-methylase UbiE
MSNRDQIREWWERPTTVSLLDQNLRKLETNFVMSHLGGDEDFADLGCGGGESTVHYAKKVKTCLALEESSHLRSKAEALFKEHGVTNVKLVKGDVLNLDEYKGNFNAVVTQRVLINFMSWEEQQKVLRNIHSTLRPGGYYIGIENTFEGFEALNSVRRSVDLPNIKLHDWHNYFLHYDKFMKFIDGLFVVEKVHTFNLYYLLTRVFVNMFANFEGFGSNAKKDAVFDAADAAARRLYEVYGDKLHFDVPKGESFGPIQGFLLRRMA